MEQQKIKSENQIAYEKAIMKNKFCNYLEVIIYVADLEEQIINLRYKRLIDTQAYRKIIADLKTKIKN